jgi:hypothetical protein
LGAVFVNYRRSDSQGEAGRLFDDLVSHFGAHRVFMDVAGIEAGRDFRKAIEESVANCAACGNRPFLAYSTIGIWWPSVG